MPELLKKTGLSVSSEQVAVLGQKSGDAAIGRAVDEQGHGRLLTVAPSQPGKRFKCNYTADHRRMNLMFRAGYMAFA